VLIWTSVGPLTLQQFFLGTFEALVSFAVSICSSQRDQGTGAMTTTGMIIVWAILGLIALSAALR
jgi:hypothetical protein